MSVLHTKKTQHQKERKGKFMGKIGYQDVDNYGGGMSDFFTLKDDKDTAQVRFMYNTIDDVFAHAVHQIEVGGKTRYVSCLRTYDEPVDQCPLCAAGFKVNVKLYVPVYDIASGTVKLWERGRSFFQKLSSLCSRYNPLVSNIMEIERNGKPGDTSTRYEIYPVEQDNVKLTDLPEIPNPLGGIILDKTFDDMQSFLELGYFPGDEQNTNVRNNVPVQRNPQTDRRPAANFNTQHQPNNRPPFNGRQGTGRPNF